MIERLIRLQRIGQLENAMSSPIELAPVTTIYGENGRGKSTFASVLRSLATGDPGAIRCGPSLGAEAPPNATVRVNGSHYVFDNGVWNQPFEDLLIFDSAFVNANVYSGEAIEPSHRQQFLQFALGAEGVRLTKEIENINVEVDGLNSRLAGLAGQLLSHADPYDVPKFVALTVPTDVEEQLVAAEKRLETLEDAARISKLSPYPILNKVNHSIDRAQAIMAKTIDDISEDAAKQVRHHIDAHLDANGEEWLRVGTSYMHDDTCPFCQQVVPPFDTIIDAYKSFFSSTYKALEVEIETMRANIDTEFSANQLELIRTQLDEAAAASVVWRELLPGPHPTIPNFGKLSDRWRHAHTNLIIDLDRKRRSPVEAMSVSDATTSAVAALASSVQALETYNQEAVRANKNIAAFKSGLTDDQVDVVRAEVKKLTAAKARLDPVVADLCASHNIATARKKEISDTKKELRTQLADYTDTMLATFQGSINEILSTFNASFRVERLDVSHVQGVPRSDLAVSVKGEPVALGQRDNQDGMQFATALSDGDKRSLALAFFLARTRVDPRIAQYVVVVDDPVASFDAPRRMATAHALASIAESARQLILMSHDAPFLRDFQQVLPSQIDHRSFELARVGSGSSLESCDLDRLCRDRYYRVYEDLLLFADKSVPAGEEEDIAMKVRKYLEGNLKARFPIELEGRNSLGKIIERIRVGRAEPWAQGVNQHLDLLDAINNATSPYHHISDERRSPPSDGELHRIVGLAFQVGWAIPTAN